MRISPLPALVTLTLVGCACSLLPPRTALDIVSRSYSAHGGYKLTRWHTLTIKGRVEIEDGITYNAAYLLLAKPPGMLRVEQDMTADRGRIFYEYFLNGDVAWSRRNLIPSRANPKQVRRWLNQCYGIAYYAANATAMEMKPETVVEWKDKRRGSTGDKVLDARPAYVVAVVVDGDSTDLCIDKQSFYLLQETRPDLRRVHHDFKDFGGVILPTRVLEVATGRRGDVLTPFTYEEVTYNRPIEDWRFAEDMPKRETARK